MRWFWIDRFTEFVSGKRASAIKCISMVENHMDGYCPGAPHHPHSLIIEGVAQTGGLLVSETEHFEARVVLAKVSRASFFRIVEPGDVIEFKVELLNRQGAGAIVEAKTFVGGELQGEFELWFAFLDARFGTGQLFLSDDLLNWLRNLRLYDVAVDQEGNPLQPPASLTDAVHQCVQQTQ